ncbi:MAG: TonB-dependent receptor [Bryobacteraceae bacterium]|nr:TonB-dependent receptor [Bryobacteraceae bacterium]MDW8379353.1 TonB-dependent receptor [Bryobacterales bacterium]
MKLKTTVLIGAILTVLVAVSSGQVSTGSMAGLITDPNGAAIPGASLTARNQANGTEVKTISSEAGLYVFTVLPTGVYTVTVEKPGFKKLTRTNLEIRVAQRLDVNFAMELGDVQQTVEVSAEAPLLETSTAERGNAVSVKMMDNLPLFAGGIRNPRVFVNYMAGVTNNGEQSVSGSGGRAQEVLIDGASALNVESSAVFNFPSAEMFSEFKMLTSNYSAEYGRVGGGIEIYVAKSGGNWFHGAAFHNMRRDIWNANAWARNANPNPAANFRPKERFNETGGSLGGPILVPKLYDGRNRSFWFFTYTKDLRPATISFPVLTVPTAAMKQGNFSQPGLPLIYDPATTAGNVRQPFPGNIIPQSRFSRISRNVVQQIPDPTRPTLAQNFDFVNQTPFDRTIWSLKFDHAFAPTHRVSFFFSNEVQSQTDLQNFPGPLGTGLNNNQKPYNYRINHDYNIKTNLLMHTTYGFSITRQTWDNPFQKGWGSRLGFNLSGDSDATPRIQFNGPAGLSPYGVQDGKVANGAQFNRQWWLSQGYTLLTGKHELKFGFAWRRFSTRGEDLAGTNGRYVFNRAQTALPTALTTTGHEFASMLLGQVDVASNVVPPVLFDTTYYYDTAVYFQDNWKVTPKFTLNLGLRYEVPIGWHIPGGNGYSHVDIRVPNPGAGGLPGALVFSGTGPGRLGVKRFYPTDFSNIGPRLGFAYQLTPKTVLRGGYAIYYQGLSSGGCGCRFGFAGSNDLQSDGLNAVINWDNGIPLQPGYRPPPIIDPTIVNFQSVQYQGPTAGQPGRIFNWSFSIQREWKNFLFDVAYQGNRGTRLNSTMDLNQLPVSRLSLGTLLQQRIDSPAAQAAGIRKPFDSFPNNLSVAQALRPFPHYLTVASLFAGFGRSWYDAMQVKVERRFGAYQLMSNYTWSKSLSYGHFRQVFSQLGSVASPQDFYNVRDAKSHMFFDIPHVLNILSTFDLPFGKGRKFLNTNNPLGSRLFSGWTVATAQVYRKGTLIQAVTPGNPLGNGVLFAPLTKANRTPGVPIRTGVDRKTLDPNNPNSRFFNVNAYTPAPLFTLGTAAFFDNDFRQPAVFTENLSIVKRTVLWENDRNPVVLIYRADGFNIFNRTNFGGIVGVVGNPNFGRPTGPQQGPRIITMGLRLEF